MKKRSKRVKSNENIGENRVFDSVCEVIDILKRCIPVKFDQSVEVSLKLGIDPKKSDQQVRGTVFLPNGTGRENVVLAIARGKDVEDALAAGANYAGGEEYVQKIQDGWLEFTVVVTTPEMMREVGKLGKILGPRGLMPTVKGGGVTKDIGVAVSEFKKGKVEFKADKMGVVNLGVGKLSFDSSGIEENVKSLLNAVVNVKPSSSKGEYLKNFHISSTMGPGFKLNAGKVLER